MGLLVIFAYTFCWGVGVSSGGIPCNGHGVPHSSPDPTHSCICEAPYGGDQCQTCVDGYYGNPIDGGACYKVCSTKDFLLSNFTFAGITIQSQRLQLHQTNSSPPFCLWLVSPESNINTTLLHLSQLSTLRNFPDSPYSQSFNQSVHDSSIFNFTLQFSANVFPFNSSSSSSPSHQSSQCYQETVLIYNGLPSFLSKRECSNHCNNSERLVASLTGARLRDATLTLVAPFLTFVYYYSGDVSNVRGFWATIEALQPDMKENEDHQDSESEECRCLTSCDCSSDFSVSTLLSSLANSIQSLATATNHTSQCNGHIFHSSTYDPSSECVLIFGGIDLSSNICQEGVVQLCGRQDFMDSSSGDFASNFKSSGYLHPDHGKQVVTLLAAAGGPAPQGRYHHSTVLLPSQGNQSSSLLVIGGFISRGVATEEVWQFNINTSQWTPKTIAPIPIAAHTATLTPGGVVVVIGGVSAGLSIHANVMSYNVVNNTWEMWPHLILQPSGAYGHTAVYDELSEQIWIFGGMMYSRPSARISGSLYSLHVPSRTWNIIHLQDQIQPRLYHSMVLNSNRLIIYGGLVTHHPEHTLEGACPSDAITVIHINDISDNSGKPAITFIGFLPKRWGHRSTYIGHNQILTSGGLDGELIEDVDIIHNVDNLCSLATAARECSLLSECVVCRNATDSTLISCLVAGNLSEIVCSDLGGELLEESFNSTITCSSLKECKECLSSDVSLALNCSWCLCENSTTCTLKSDCSCASEDYTTPEVCVLDVCGYASCNDCLLDSNCTWLSSRLTRNEIIHTSLDVSLTSVEWGCYRSSINGQIVEKFRLNFSLGVCPVSCDKLETCDECVSSNNSHSGSQQCVWASYSGECMSEDSIPLLCATGTCGRIYTSSNKCTPTCSDRSSCTKCQQSPECSWKPGNRTQQGMCFNLAEVQDSTIGKLKNCPECSEDCEEHGQCSHSGECLCDFGFVGMACNVTCACNGFSNCANETKVGRATCLNCINNTMGPSCEQCKPFYVGSPKHGNGGCSSCLDFCTSNSNICISQSTLQKFLDGNFKENEFTEPGPTEDEAVCFKCGNGTIGNYCNCCPPGYFNDSVHHTRSSLICTKCNCNGHSEECDNTTGECTCKDNTETITGLFNNQCNRCVSGYVGSPINNSQCYKDSMPGNILNYTLRSNEIVFLATGRNVEDGSSSYLSIVLQKGAISVYVASSSSAVQLVKSDYGRRQIIISNPFEVKHKVRRSANILKVESRLTSAYIDKKYKRDLFGNISPFSQANVVSEYRVNDRLALLIDQTESITNVERYLTISALQNSTFYFNYVQHKNSRQPILIFIVTLTAFVLVFLLVIAIVKIVGAIKNQYHTSMMRRQQQRRAYRPLKSIILFLDPKKSTITDNVIKDSKSTMANKFYYTYGSEQKMKMKKCTADDLNIWPVAMQPTVNQEADIYSVLVQGPASRNGRYILCAGVALVHSSSSTESGNAAESNESNREAQICLQEIHGHQEVNRTQEDNETEDVHTTEEQTSEL